MSSGYNQRASAPFPPWDIRGRNQINQHIAHPPPNIQSNLNIHGPAGPTFLPTQSWTPRVCLPSTTVVPPLPAPPPMRFSSFIPHFIGMPPTTLPAIRMPSSVGPPPLGSLTPIRPSVGLQVPFSAGPQTISNLPPVNSGSMPMVSIGNLPPVNRTPVMEVQIPPSFRQSSVGNLLSSGLSSVISFQVPSPINANSGFNSHASNHFRATSPHPLTVINMPPPPMMSNNSFPTSANFQAWVPSSTEPQLIAQQTTKIEEQNLGRADEDWIEALFAGRSKIPNKQHKPIPMTVCNARTTLVEVVQALTGLRETIKFLSNSMKVDDAMWEFKLRKAKTAKEKLNALISQFSSDTILHLKAQLKKINKKRRRLKQKRLEVRENQQLKLQERDQLHLTIDTLRKRIQDDVLKEKKKEELKCEADNILSEVRKKIQEARKSLEHLDVLVKLRAVRLENAEKKGLMVSSASTEMFEATVEELQKLMQNQLKVYVAEEHALKVMLETEREQERHHKLLQKMEALNKCKKDLINRLFDKPPDSSSPLYFYWQYYMQGNTNLDALVQIRQIWDSFLVMPDDALGSPIPLGWVLPSPPSSSQWESVLALNDIDSDS